MNDANGVLSANSCCSQIENALNKRRHRDQYAHANSAAPTPALAHDGPSVTNSSHASPNPSLSSNSPVFTTSYKAAAAGVIGQDEVHDRAYTRIAEYEHSGR